MAIKVMISDDNKELCDVLHAQLKISGYDVVAVAHDGLQALELIRVCSPELLILDIVMPYMDGFGVLGGMSEMTNPPITVIYSAISDDYVTAKAMSMGASMYFAKPLDPAILIGRLDDIFRREAPILHASKSEERHLDKLSLMMHELSLPPHQLGYKYLVRAISILNKNPRSSIGDVYAEIAACLSITVNSVERCMRHSIESAWNRCHPDVIEKYFGYTVDISKDKPTNSEFISMLADRLKI